MLSTFVANTKPGVGTPAPGPDHIETGRRHWGPGASAVVSGKGETNGEGLGMKRAFGIVALAFVLPMGVATAQDAAGPVDTDYIWDLTELYPSLEAWSQAREEVLQDLEKVEARQGTLGDSADSMFQSLALLSDVTRKAGRVSAYASLGADEDLRLATAQERRQLSQIMFTRLSEATSWVQPEILRVGGDTIQSYLDEDARLSRFEFRLRDGLRRAPHTLGDESEKTLSYLSQVNSAPRNIYSVMANSDIPWPNVTLSTGEEHRIDSQGYARWRAAESRDDRKLVFDAFWSKWLEYRNSVGAVLNTHIQTQVATARARGYESVLQRELFDDNLPEAIYRTLVEEVNKAIPTLHRYFRLRAKMLGVDSMHYYDIYPPLVALERQFDIEASKKITLEAMAVLGSDWVDMQREAVGKRWMHVFPQRGKRSGAYMNSGAYDVHPYVLLNHNDDYDSLSTFAHEWGHAMHTLYASQKQPFDTVFYSTFIAEIPSTSLELILQDYMTKNAKSVDEKLFYLGNGLESMRATFFRQTMFAELELVLYEMVERGEALSGERISEIYAQILKRYHGHDQGVVTIDDLYTNEWMFVPHFYLNMYMYQYATSQTAGTALYQGILEDRDAGVAKFKNLLRAGGSDYPYVLLKDAGVDMATPEPYRAAVSKMNAIMDQMEELLRVQAETRP